MKSKILRLLKSKLFKNSVWLTILQFVNTILPLVTIPYITRILGTNEYGVFSIALNWILYLQVLVEFGFGLSGARKVAILNDNEQKKLNKLYSNILSSRIILFIISLLILNIIALLSSISFKIYICMLILSTMILGTTLQLTWLFQGKQDMKFITIISGISRFISVALIFLFVNTNQDVYLYCLLYAITLLLSSVISIVVAKKKYKLKFSFSSYGDIKREINEAKYLFASSAMTKIFSGFGTTILGIFSSTAITGVFSAIYKIPYILTVFFSPISQALYPYNSAKFKKGFSYGVDSVKKIGKPIFIMFTILSLIIILFRTPIVSILFGKEYSDYSIIVIPLVIQFLFAMINNFLGIQILVASNNSKQYSKAFAIGSISIILLNLILGKIYGIYGVSIAATIGEIVLTISLLYSFNKVKKKYYNKKKV